MTLTVLVTGATGFVGRSLVEFLGAQPGVMVRAISRQGGAVGSTPVDVVDLAAAGALDIWSRSQPRFDAIFHLAAQIPGTNTPAGEAVLAANVSATRSALCLAGEHGAFMAYASSAFIHKPGAIGVIDENLRPSPSSQYHLSKWVGEELCRGASGLRGAQLRIAAVYGPRQTSRTVLRLFLERAKASQELLVHGSGCRTQDFVHVSDVVRAMWLAFQAQSEGAYHVASGTSISMWDLAHLVRACVPGCTSVIRHSGDPDPQDDVRWAFSIARAREHFGFVPTVGLEVGIQQMVEAS